MNFTNFFKANVSVHLRPTASTVSALIELLLAECKYFFFRFVQENTEDGLIFCKSGTGYHITHYKHYCFCGNIKEEATETISSIIHQYHISKYPLRSN